MKSLILLLLLVGCSDPALIHSPLPKAGDCFLPKLSYIPSSPSGDRLVKVLEVYKYGVIYKHLDGCDSGDYMLYEEFAAEFAQCDCFRKFIPKCVVKK
jgi:hypothetical protein